MIELTEEQLIEADRFIIGGRRSFLYEIFITRYLEQAGRRWGYSFSIIGEPKRGALDEKYPHKCRGCNKELYFAELLLANPELKPEYVKKLWKSQSVEFYCCSCYRKETNPDTQDWWFQNEYEQNPAVDMDYGRDNIGVRGLHYDWMVADEGIFEPDEVFGINLEDD